MAEIAGVVDDFETGGGPRAYASSVRTSWHAFTVEHAIYVATFLVALGVRFWGLPRLPLNTLEALNSWAAWQAANTVTSPVDGTPASALFLHLQTLVFWIGANGDAAARIVSAAAGTLLVLVPWLLRGLLGRTAAVTLSILLALDPWLVAFSRFADGAMLSTLLAVLLLALLVQLLMLDSVPNTSDGSTPGADVAGRRRRYTTFCALAAGLFLTSGPMTWSYLPVLFAFSAMNFAGLRRAFVADWITAAWFAAAFVAGATGWLTQPADVALVSASLTAWSDISLSPFLPGLSTSLGVPYPAGWPVGTLLANQPFVALFGIAGLVHMTWRRRTPTYNAVRWHVILWVWLAWGVALNLLPGRSPFSLLVLIVPLLFATAHTVSILIAAVPAGPGWKETAAVVGTLLLLMISALFWGAALVAGPALDMLMLQAVVLILLLSGAILVFFGMWTTWNEAVWAGAVVLGFLLLTANVGATWRVNHWFDLGRPSALFAESGDLGVRQLAENIETLSAQRAGDPYEIPVVVEPSAAQASAGASPSAPAASGRDAILAWYLRNMRRLQWGDGGDANPATQEIPLVITGSGAGGEHPLLGGRDYVGSDYSVRYTLPAVPAIDNFPPDVGSGQQGPRAQLERVWSERIQPWLRWTLYRRVQIQPAAESVTLWAPRNE